MQDCALKAEPRLSFVRSMGVAFQSGMRARGTTLGKCWKARSSLWYVCFRLYVQIAQKA